VKSKLFAIARELGGKGVSKTLDSVLMDLKLQKDLFGEIDSLGLRLHHSEFSDGDGKLGLYVGKDKVYGGLNFRF